LITCEKDYTMKRAVFQFQIGDRVRNEWTLKQGTVRQRRHILIQKRRNIDNNNQYEIAGDDGSYFIELETDLRALRMLAPVARGRRSDDSR